MGDSTEFEVNDDLNVDEQQESVAESLPFEDPVIDEEQESPQEAPPPVEALVDPLPSPPEPPPTYTPPAYDGGFTPQQSTRQEAAQEQQNFTVEQLRQGVDEGVITEAMMVGELQRQNQVLASRAAREAVVEQQKASTITNQLNQYRQYVPGWDQPGTPAYNQALPHYNRLVQTLGLPETDSTRLLAVETAFGPVQRIQADQESKKRTAELRETSQEVGGRGAPPTSRARKDPLDSLSKDSLKLYKKYINEGHYKNWDAVRADVAHEQSKVGSR